MVLKQVFFSKNYKNRPQTPVNNTFELHFFTQHVSQFRHFHILTIGLSSPPRERVPSYVPTPPGQGF